MASFFSCLVDCAGFDLLHPPLDDGDDVQRNTSSRHRASTGGEHRSYDSCAFAENQYHPARKSRLSLRQGTSEFDPIIEIDETAVIPIYSTRSQKAVSPSTCPPESLRKRVWTPSEKAFPEDHIPLASGASSDNERSEKDAVADKNPEDGVGGVDGIVDNDKSRVSTPLSITSTTGAASAVPPTPTPKLLFHSTAMRLDVTAGVTTPALHTPPRTPPHSPSAIVGLGDYSPVDRSSLPKIRSIVRSRSEGPTRGGLLSASSPRGSNGGGGIPMGIRDGHGKAPRPPTARAVGALDGSSERGVVAVEEDDCDESEAREGIGGLPRPRAPASKKPPFRSASMVSSKSTIEMKQDQSIDDTYDAEEEYLNEVAGAPASPKRKDKAGYKRMNSVPTAKELQAASTPGRQRKNDGTGEMARRVVAKWGEQVGDEDDDDFHVDLAEKSPRRRSISTTVRHLRLSQDGRRVTVAAKDGVNHELALHELVEVQGTPSKNRVVLRGEKLELRVGFEGDNNAFQQFREALVPNPMARRRGKGMKKHLHSELPPATPRSLPMAAAGGGSGGGGMAGIPLQVYGEQAEYDERNNSGNSDTPEDSSAASGGTRAAVRAGANVRVHTLSSSPASGTAGCFKAAASVLPRQPPASITSMATEQTPAGIPSSESATSGKNPTTPPRPSPAIPKGNDSGDCAPVYDAPVLGVNTGASKRNGGSAPSGNDTAPRATGAPLAYSYAAKSSVEDLGNPESAVPVRVTTNTSPASTKNSGHYSRSGVDASGESGGGSVTAETREHAAPPLAGPSPAGESSIGSSRSIYRHGRPPLGTWDANHGSGDERGTGMARSDSAAASEFEPSTATEAGGTYASSSPNNAPTLGSKFNAPSPASVLEGTPLPATTMAAGVHDYFDTTPPPRSTPPRAPLSMQEDGSVSSTSSQGGASNISDALSYTSSPFMGAGAGHPSHGAGQPGSPRLGGTQTPLQQPPLPAPSPAAKRFDRAVGEGPARMLPTHRIIPDRARHANHELIGDGGVSRMGESGNGPPPPAGVYRREGTGIVGKNGQAIGSADAAAEAVPPRQAAAKQKRAPAWPPVPSVPPALGPVPETTSTSSVASEIAKRNASASGVVSRNSYAGGGGVVSSARSVFEPRGSSAPAPVSVRGNRSLSSSQSPAPLPLGEHPHRDGSAEGVEGSPNDSGRREDDGGDGGEHHRVNGKGGFVAGQRSKYDHDWPGINGSSKTGPEVARGEGVAQTNSALGSDGKGGRGDGGNGDKGAGVQAAEYGRYQASGNNDDWAKSAPHTGLSGPVPTPVNTQEFGGDDTASGAPGTPPGRFFSFSTPTFGNSPQHFINKSHANNFHDQQQPPQQQQLAGSGHPPPSARRDAGTGSVQGRATPPVRTRSRRPMNLDKQAPNSSLVDTPGASGSGSAFPTDGRWAGAQSVRSTGSKNGRETPPVHGASSPRSLAKQTPQSSFMGEIGDTDVVT